ncbi:sulfatase [bacterium]|nr:sulfatase [bacterium]
MTPLLLSLAAFSPADRPVPPNVVLLIADDLGAEDCGPFGNRAVRAPNLDRLARDGMRFDRAFVPASSCSPSRCSLITGRYPHSHGAPQLHQPLPAGQPNLAALLRAAGYWTAIAGKTHLGKDALAAFDVVNAGGGPSGCEQWVATLRQRPMNRPFFAWLAALDPHRDYQPNTIPEPHRPADVVVPPYLPDTPEVRADLARYYDEIARLDRFVGEVLGELDRQGVANNTLVLFLSDNGRPFPRCKTTVYDSGCRTPLIARWPAGGVRAGSVTGSLVSTIDVAPTLLGLAGALVPGSVQGRGFAAVLRDPTAKHREYVFLEKNWHDFDDHARAVRSARYRYVRNSYLDVPMTPPADAVRSPTFQAMLKLHDAGQLPPEQRTCFPTPRPAEEFYDLDADPHELRNVVADPRHAEALRTHRAALEGWVKEMGDPVPATRTPDGFDRRTGRPIKQ